MPDHAIDALAEIFAWVGLGLGALFAGVALVMYLLDGTWLPTRAVVEKTEQGRVVRWFDEDGGVNQAHLNHEQDRAVGDHEMTDVYYRRGYRGRMRLTQGSPAVRAVAFLAAGLVAFGMLSLVLSLVLLFARG